MDSNELVDSLERSVFRLYRNMRRETAREGLSPQDPVLLKQIGRNPGLGVSELAALERLRTPTITSHAIRLEKAGLIKRAPDAVDRRRVGLHLTAKGHKAIDRATEIRHAVIAERLATLSDQEIAVLEAAAATLFKLGEEDAPGR
ncbi:MAG: transcriptional regulator, MarR family [Caulobacter sp.]|nr:transcriptional regulator, MarR family [Caulobacter sp.]